MRILKQALGALTLSALAFTSMTAGASPADPKNGVEYKTLPAPQPTDAGKKIEVTEFFAYYCPYCNAFEPALEAWVKKHSDSVVLKRVHVPSNESVLPQQRLYFTLEALGLANEQTQAKVFEEMHVAHNRLDRDEKVFDLAAKLGIERQKFIDTYRSLGVQARVRKAGSMKDDYRIESWPTIAIDGRYLTSPSMADEGSHSATDEKQLGAEALQVMDFLVAKAKAEKK